MNLREYEKILRSVLGTIEEGVHVVDANGITIYYSEKMAEVEKIKPEDVLGKPFREVFSHIPEGESTLLKALKRGEKTVDKTQTYLNKYARKITTVNTTVPIMSGNKVIAAVEISKDITVLMKMTNMILDLQSKTLKKGKDEKHSQIRKYKFENIIGNSENFLNVINVAQKASRNSAPVFIYGETGTGKELIAQSIHFASKRCEKPFLAQNCAAIPGSLLEGMLFGTVKGGFTGAIDRVGFFEQANGGTLLLDEISAMPLELQGKLLRVLQEEYIRRIGGIKDIPIDVRIIATANELPLKLIEEGKLRKDLYYRLNIVNISIPPLRERKEDIGILVKEFIEKNNQKYGTNVKSLSKEAEQKLTSHNYPGNVRELDNIISSAMAMIDDETVIPEGLINIDECFGGMADELLLNSLINSEAGLNECLERIEKDMIKKALQKSHGNVSKAARILKLQRQTLQHKMKKYDEDWQIYLL